MPLLAGLPVQVGLYTAFVPMVVYAVLGTSRPLSVSTTTTIGILTEVSKNEGAIVVPLERMEKFRLPRVPDIEAKVDRGECLDDSDLAQLDDVLAGVEDVKRCLDERLDLQGSTRAPWSRSPPWWEMAL